MAADKRNPRRGGSGGGGPRGGGGNRGGQGGRPPRQPSWQGPPRQPGRPDRGGPGRGGPRETPSPWSDQRAPERSGPRPLPGPRSRGRWEALEVESLDELAVALNTLGVQPERLIRQVARSGEADAHAPTAEGWVALVWVD